MRVNPLVIKVKHANCLPEEEETLLFEFFDFLFSSGKPATSPQDGLRNREERAS
jgi:hypothetical protein